MPPVASIFNLPVAPGARNFAPAMRWSKYPRWLNNPAQVLVTGACDLARARAACVAALYSCVLASHKRQVIVFTHDIYFLCILQQCAAELELDLDPQCIRRAPGGFGVQSDRVPFDAMPTSKRVGALRAMRTKVSAAKRAGDEQEHVRLTRDAYYNLRLAWERAVEEVLLFGVVTRFEEGVSTQKFRSVIVDDADYNVIEAGMTKCSKFAHDPALGAQLPTPEPDELAADIETLETWRLAVEARPKGIRDRRT